MDNKNELSDELKKARRKENQAHNDLDYYKRQAEQQKEQLDEQLNHKDECIARLISAKESGLSPILIREQQVLLAHISSVVETVSYKVDLSQENLAKAEDAWNKENDRYETMKNSSGKVSSDKNSSEKDSSSQQTESAADLKLELSVNKTATMASKTRGR